MMSAPPPSAELHRVLERRRRIVDGVGADETPRSAGGRAERWFSRVAAAVSRRATLPAGSFEGAAPSAAASDAASSAQGDGELRLSPRTPRGVNGQKAVASYMHEIRAEVLSLGSRRAVTSSSWLRKVDSLRSQRDGLEQLVEELRRRTSEQEAELAELRAQLERAGGGEPAEGQGALRAEVARLRRKLERAGLSPEADDDDEGGAAVARGPLPERAAADRQGAASPELLLRDAMTRPGGASSAELRGAMGALADLLQAAKQELDAQELRERRAACDARLLEAPPRAAPAARAAEEGEASPGAWSAAASSPRPPTPEELDARHLEQAIEEAKRVAFLFARRDQAEELRDLLASVGAEVDWRSWCDYSGRSLVTYARQLRSTRVLEMLDPPAAAPAPARAARASRLELSDACDVPTSGAMRLCSSVASTAASDHDVTPSFCQCDAGAIWSVRDRSGSPAPASPTSPTSPQSIAEQPDEAEPVTKEGAAATDAKAEPVSKEGVAATDAKAVAAPDAKVVQAPPCRAAAKPSLEPCSPTAMQGSNQDTVKMMSCFRAVAQNDAERLAELLTDVPIEVWSVWQNKAGKDLISLSQERGASLAYSALARALGVLVERKHSSLEHGAAVWIHEPGEMQPRRATVARAARADAREVLVEFWDGDAPEMWVQRALVSKAYT